MVVLFCVVYLSCHWHRLPVLLCHGVAALPVCELPSSSYPLPQLPDRSCYSNLHKGPAVILQQLAPRCCYSAAIGVTLPRRSCSCGQRVHSTHAGVKLASYFVLLELQRTSANNHHFVVLFLCMQCCEANLF